MKLYLFINWLALYMHEKKAVFAEESTIYVCSGDSIQLFRHVTIDSIDMVVSLYIQASNERNLAMWTSNNSFILDGYTRKVFLDKNGGIWIRNVSPSDEAQYILISRNGTNSFRDIVTLSVQAAPTINCKPTIKRMGDILFASLNANECGKPLASVDWLYHPGSHNEGNELILPKTNKYGIYYACISGPCVKCAKTSKLSEYCSTYAIDNTLDGHDDSSEYGIERRLSTYFVAIITSIAILLVLYFIGLWLYFRRKCRNETRSAIEKNTKRGYEKNIRYYSSTENKFDMTIKTRNDREEDADASPLAEKIF